AHEALGLGTLAQLLLLIGWICSDRSRGARAAAGPAVPAHRGPHAPDRQRRQQSARRQGPCHDAPPDSSRSRSIRMSRFRPSLTSVRPCFSTFCVSMGFFQEFLSGSHDLMSVSEEVWRSRCAAPIVFQPPSIIAREEPFSSWSVALSSDLRRPVDWVPNLRKEAIHRPNLDMSCPSLLTIRENTRTALDTTLATAAAAVAPKVNPAVARALRTHMIASAMKLVMISRKSVRSSPTAMPALLTPSAVATAASAVARRTDSNPAAASR